MARVTLVLVETEPGVSEEFNIPSAEIRPDQPREGFFTFLGIDAQTLVVHGTRILYVHSQEKTD